MTMSIIGQAKWLACLLEVKASKTLPLFTMALCWRGAGLPPHLKLDAQLLVVILLFLFQPQQRRHPNHGATRSNTHQHSIFIRSLNRAMMRWLTSGAAPLSAIYRSAWRRCSSSP